MKPFDCEEADDLMVGTAGIRHNFSSNPLFLRSLTFFSQCKAKESYDAAVTWSLELIEDYRIRIG